MITKNFKALLGIALQSLGNIYYGYLLVKGTDGNNYYVAGIQGTYPNAVSTGLTTSAGTAGIVLGSGETAATENDYRIETPLTTVSATVTYERSLDANGNPVLEFNLVVTNTGSEAITVKEIAYNQTFKCSTTQGGTSTNNKVVCIDRTVLSTPVTIAVGSSAVVKYTLKTILGVSA